jgi:hypothetical protein
MDAVDLKHHLQDLHAEHVAALAEGLADNSLYLADLEHELATTEAAYVGAAVTEIASLRAALNGPLLG